MVFVADLVYILIIIVGWIIIFGYYTNGNGKDNLHTWYTNFNNQCGQTD